MKNMKYLLKKFEEYSKKILEMNKDDEDYEMIKKSLDELELILNEYQKIINLEYAHAYN